MLVFLNFLRLFAQRIVQDLFHGLSVDLSLFLLQGFRTGFDYENIRTRYIGRIHVQDYITDLENEFRESFSKFIDFLVGKST